jgi:hypothetical protein
LVARDEILEGYGLDQDYMKWLKEHHRAKWTKLSKPAPSKQAVGKAASKRKDESSISSISQESIADTNGFDGGFDDCNYSGAPAATTTLAKRKPPSVNSVSVRSEDQSDLRSMVMDIISDSRKEDKKQFSRFEQQLGGFQDQFCALERKVESKISTIESNLGELRDEIGSDQTDLKEVLVFR